jgi:hypothetical protein
MGRMATLTAIDFTPPGSTGERAAPAATNNQLGFLTSR